VVGIVVVGGGAARHHLGAELGVAGEDPEVAELMLPRRRDGRDEPSEQIFGLEQKRLGAVAPGELEGELHAAVGAEREALLRQGRGNSHLSEQLRASLMSVANQ